MNDSYRSNFRCVQLCLHPDPTIFFFLFPLFFWEIWTFIAQTREGGKAHPPSLPRQLNRRIYKMGMGSTQLQKVSAQQTKFWASWLAAQITNANHIPFQKALFSGLYIRYNFIWRFHYIYQNSHEHVKH